MNPYKIKMNGGDVDMGDGPQYYREEEEDQFFDAPHEFPAIDWGDYCDARKMLENVCKVYAETIWDDHPGIQTDLFALIMENMPAIMTHHISRNPTYKLRDLMIFSDIAFFIFQNAQKNPGHCLFAGTIEETYGLQFDILDYMENYGGKFWYNEGNGSYYNWFLKHGIVPTGNWQEDVRTAEAIELQERQRQANDDAMANAFGDMRVQSRLPTVIPRSRTVRDVVGRVAASRKTKCAVRMPLISAYQGTLNNSIEILGKYQEKWQNQLNNKNPRPSKKDTRKLKQNLEMLADFLNMAEGYKDFPDEIESEDKQAIEKFINEFCK